MILIALLKCADPCGCLVSPPRSQQWTSHQRDNEADKLNSGVFNLIILMVSLLPLHLKKKVVDVNQLLSCTICATFCFQPPGPPLFSHFLSAWWYGGLGTVLFPHPGAANQKLFIPVILLAAALFWTSLCGWTDGCLTVSDGWSLNLNVLGKKGLFF